MGASIKASELIETLIILIEEDATKGLLINADCLCDSCRYYIPSAVSSLTCDSCPFNTNDVSNIETLKNILPVIKTMELIDE